MRHALKSALQSGQCKMKNIFGNFMYFISQVAFVLH